MVAVYYKLYLLVKIHPKKKKNGRQDPSIFIQAHLNQIARISSDISFTIKLSTHIKSAKSVNSNTKLAIKIHHDDDDAFWSLSKNRILPGLNSTYQLFWDSCQRHCTAEYVRMGRAFGGK